MKCPTCGYANDRYLRIFWILPKWWQFWLKGRQGVDKAEIDRVNEGWSISDRYRTIAEQQRDEALALLRELEWVRGMPDDQCPVCCHAHERGWHSNDCRLAALLKQETDTP